MISSPGYFSASAVFALAGFAEAISQTDLYEFDL
jgi:hypothetical protein